MTKLPNRVAHVEPIDAARQAAPAALRAQAATLLALADALERPAATSAPSTARRYATAKSNPWGSSRGFLVRARRGDFRTFKIGREVAALWTDCEAVIEASARAPRREVANDAPPLTNDEARRAALLERAGIPMRRAGGVR